MKVEEVRQLTSEELTRKLDDLQRELFNARIKRFTDNTPDVMRARRLKRDIARIRTVLAEGEKGINVALHPSASKEA